MRAVRFRWAAPADYDELGDVMFDAVRNGETRYSDTQNAAWVPEPRSGEQWAERLRSQKIVVAEEQGSILGFISLASKGYVDFAYIRPKHQGLGIFRQLFARIEHQAKLENEPVLWVHASLMARPAFSAMGFEIRDREEVTIGSERFERFVMEKKLSGT